MDIDDNGQRTRITGRAARIVRSVIAHNQALSGTPRGQLRVSWGDQSLRVVLEVHFDDEPPDEPVK